MNLWKNYYCTTYRESEANGYVGRSYLFINRRKPGIDARMTSFRIMNTGIFTHSKFLILKYNDWWEIYAPLIVEYVINDLKLDTIYLDDMYDGN